MTTQQCCNSAASPVCCDRTAAVTKCSRLDALTVRYDQVGASDFSMISATVAKHMHPNLGPEDSRNEEFVKELEAAIEHELKVLNCPTSGPSLARLQVYRQAFDILMKHFR